MGVIETIFMVVEVVLLIALVIINKYASPKINDKIEKATAEFQVILSYAESFCAYAKQFLSDLTGSEKMDAVVERLKTLCGQMGIDMDDEILRAIAQKAYNNMVSSELPNILDAINVDTDELDTFEYVGTEDEITEIEE